MLTDPIADFLTRIRNAANSRKNHLSVSYSSLKKNIAQAMKNSGLIEAVEVTASPETGKITGMKIVLSLSREPLSLKRISRSGQRIYVRAKNIKRVKNGFGIGLYSTSQGILTDAQAREKKIGGEYLCQIW